MLTLLTGNVTWLSSNLAGSYKRAAGMAIHIGIGNLAGAMASNFYRAEDSPKYILGHALEIGFCVAGITAVLVLRFGYQRTNQIRQRKIEQGELEKWTEEELSSKGDKSLTFRYVL